MKTKKQILDELKNLGWEYVEDEFTNSEFGHRREHFKRVKKIIFDEAETYIAEAILIFHYIENGNHKLPHIQTYQALTHDYEEAFDSNNVIHYDEAGCVPLEFKEMELFYQYMCIIKEEDENEDSGNLHVN